jgi:hypothetical protein
VRRRRYRYPLPGPFDLDARDFSFGWPWVDIVIGGLACLGFLMLLVAVVFGWR